jgi:hypothetical protein
VSHILHALPAPMLIQRAPVSVGCIPGLRLHELTAVSRAQGSAASQVGIDQADALSAEILHLDSLAVSVQFGFSRFRQEFTRCDCNPAIWQRTSSSGAL